MKSNGIARLLLHEKPAGILLSLHNSDGKYASILSKENDCTYTHTLKILSQLEENRIVEFKKEGRIKFVELTTLGEDVAHELEGLIRHLERGGKQESPIEPAEETDDE